MALTTWFRLAVLVSTISQTPGPLRSGRDVDSPQRIEAVAPDYPRVARSNWIQGVVVLDVIVDGRGSVASVETLRSIPALDEAAIEAVRRWRFEPTIVDGRTRPVAITVPVRFQLPGAEEWLTVPEGDARLEIERYDLLLAEDGKWKYLGSVKNISDERISSLHARVSFVEMEPEASAPPPELEPPRKLNHVLPRYPREARRSRIQGVVIAEVHIDASGDVENVRLLRSIPPLDPAVLAAVRQWKYEPFRRDGVPIPGRLLARFGFWDGDVELTEAVPTGGTGDRRARTVDIPSLEPGDAADFEVELIPTPGREVRNAVLDFRVRGDGESHVVSARRQRRTLPAPDQP